MDKDVLLMLLREIHIEAAAAYWTENMHCGGNVADDCDGCSHYDQCRREEAIGRMLKEGEV